MCLSAEPKQRNTSVHKFDFETNCSGPVVISESWIVWVRDQTKAPHVRTQVWFSSSTHNFWFALLIPTWCPTYLSGHVTVFANLCNLSACSTTHPRPHDDTANHRGSRSRLRVLLSRLGEICHTWVGAHQDVRGVKRTFQELLLCFMDVYSSSACLKSNGAACQG